MEKLGACRVRTIRSPSQKILHLDYICLGYPYLKQIRLCFYLKKVPAVCSKTNISNAFYI